MAALSKSLAIVAIALLSMTGAAAACLNNVGCNGSGPSKCSTPDC